MTRSVISIELKYMKTIKHFLLGAIVGLGFLTTVSAGYYYPNSQTYTNNSNNSVYIVTPSYTYTSGCYIYYYNGTTRNSSVIGYSCTNNNYSNNYTNYTYPVTSNYTYTVPSTYYTNSYSVPSTYYTNTYSNPYNSSYYYQNTATYPTTYTTYDTGYNNAYYYYNTGYTDTGYNNTYYNSNYNNGYKYVDPNPCYDTNGYQVCY